ncbi:hypothetical protein [Acidovorax sp. BLS4]|uniref:hypothetical protein n=1 Tax=Acidovorax sp. BLS4 TaxID=3273430 RepID=UPI002943B4A8|nr:hypothetical protein [Paracidovorax avenae]WOI43762.1 hypothetical protein R1Z03_14575 [Paracidovorax avenae]
MKRRSHHKAAARASYALQREFKVANEAAAAPIGGAITPQAFRKLIEALAQESQPPRLDLDALCAQARAAVRSTVERRACAHEVAILKASDAEIDRTHAIYRAYRRDVDAIFRRLSNA